MTKEQISNALAEKGVDLSNLDNWSMAIEGFKWLLDNIPEGSKILEIGAGRGTKELSKFWDVTSVEHNQEYINLVPNVKYILAPLVNGWYSIDTLKQELPQKYELLIIDGPPGEEGRPTILANLDLFNLDCKIMVDDVHRGGSLNIAKAIGTKLSREVIVHQGWQKKFATIE